MPRTLMLMEETDLPAVERVVVEALSGHSIMCGIGWQHDDERLFLTVETDIPAAKIGDVYRKAVAPLLDRLEGEFGEFGFEMRALCACGGVATPMISGDNPEHDMCICGECLDRRIDERRDGPRNTCPVCEKGFDGLENPGWRANCSAKFGSEADEARPEMDIGTIRIGGADGSTDMDRWDCCSRECALEQFRRWLFEVEAHQVAKEARP